MHERIGILALLAGCIFVTVPASAADKVASPVTKKNWHNHPAIVDIRKLFQENEAELKAGNFVTKELPACELPSRQMERTAFIDAQGRIRKFVVNGGSDDSAYRLEHHYDEKGRLRFAFGRTGAVNDTTVEHRLYYSEGGKLLWHDRKQRGPGYPFLMDWPQKYVVRDAAKELGVQPDCRD
ncbi:hypothetical protein [Archangium violaceum]|uniref:hypothetical protein n=1 Tax=Archangium violaceum TaxID=83451 RepID=UPI0036D78D3E